MIINEYLMIIKNALFIHWHIIVHTKIPWVWSKQFVQFVIFCSHLLSFGSKLYFLSVVKLEYTLMYG